VKTEILFGAALLVASFMPRTVSADGAPLKSAPDGRPLALTFADEFHDFPSVGRSARGLANYLRQWPFALRGPDAAQQFAERGY
jgi:hypothetical protein